MRVTLFDYGAGNLHSLSKALVLAGGEVRIEPDPVKAVDTDILVLPGVGAFGSAADRLAPGRAAIREAVSAGLPCLGICLGMQLLFDKSEEGAGEGLGLIPGVVTKLRAERVPQIGWNTLDLEGIEGDPDGFITDADLRIAYFANSYVCRPANEATVAAWATHEGDRYAAMVRDRDVVGVQFHPEKQSTAGVRFLRAFVEGVAR